MSTYAVIMAGGVGSRFWPLSRKAHPKQFLKVFGDRSLLQNTVDRLSGLIPPERCLIVTHERYVDETRGQLPEIPEQNILAEPIGRNTAPCIHYAALKLFKKDPDAVMVVLPADHLIADPERFRAVLDVAIAKARDPGSLVTIGITPDYPATGYGYIQFDGAHNGHSDEKLHVLPVKTFAEKPDHETAERFLDSGDFLWNSGMFVWRADTIIEQMRRLLPKTYDAFKAAQDKLWTSEEDAAIRDAYQACQSISIDYVVMEHAVHVFVVPGSFGWSDVGDWQAVYDLSEKDRLGNALRGNVIVQDSSRCLVHADARLVVLVGVHDAVVIDTDDAILVGNRDSVQQVKTVVEYMRAHQLSEYT